MMFLVLFSSLAAAMAVVAQSNLRTADSALSVSRAMSAAETGLVFAQRRLQEETRRFVVEEGLISEGFGSALWDGTIDVSDYDLLPPTGYTAVTAPAGIGEAILQAHTADDHAIIAETGDASLPTFDSNAGLLRARPIALTDEVGSPYFRLRYEWVGDDGFPVVRVWSEGVDRDITRVLSMDFVIDKRIDYAILSPNRIMIGKNVMIEGPLGTRYGLVAGELDTDNGDPIVVRSDFYFLDPALSAKLDTLYAAILDYDVDGDARLRPAHPVESQGVDTDPELVDYDGDEYVDDFDLFLAHYDGNNDGMVTYDATLAAAAGLGSLSVEFTGIDDQLSRLIDLAHPDRDQDGDVTASDRGLGFQDGVMDINDQYAKIAGELAIAVGREPWETAHGESYQTVVEGPIRIESDETPITFDVESEDLLEITTDMLDDAQDWFEAQVTTSVPVTPGGAPLDPQVVADAGTGGTYTIPTDNEFEEVPFGSSGAYDHYQRPVYDGMTFSNLRIPMGNNGLFTNCTFVGVTYVESTQGCSDVNWNYAGAVEPVTDPGTGDTTFEPKFPDLQADMSGTLVDDTRLYSNNIRFDDCTFLGSVAGDQLDDYTHWRNKIQMTGNTRFYVDPDADELLAQADSGTLVPLLEGLGDTQLTDLAKSQILMPGWSVDVGNFTNVVGASPADTPRVELRGTIIAGILDIRGTADVFGTLLMTFRPQEDAGPLHYGGQLDAFNTTIGYFGPQDGDNEGADEADFGFGEIRLRYNPDALLPDGIPWPVHAAVVPESYSEGGL